MASDYFMEDEREAHRLTQKVEPAQWVEQYFAKYISTVSCVLDVGCGPGALAAEVAKRFPQVSVQGVDVSENRLAHAKGFYQLPNLKFERANSKELPFSDGSFDVVYSRLMLEYLDSPGAAIKEMKRVCKTGGRVILQDLDGQLVWNYPEPKFEGDLQLVVNALSKTGHDVFVGRKLYHHAYNAGLKNIKVNVDPYHLYAGIISEKEYKEWELKLDIASPEVEKVLGKAKAQELKENYLSYLKNEGTLTYSVLFTVVGEVI